jgi:hypothetical protein
LGRYSAGVSRSPAKAADVLRLMQALGRYVRGPGRVYFTGGATAVMKGWREATVDVDVKLDPEPAGVFEAIARIKEELSLNVELASPDQFIPDLPESKLRAEFIGREGDVEFFHFDLYAQALAKIERGHARDLADATAMVRTGEVDPQRLVELFEAIEPGLLRFPGISADAFRAKLERFLQSVRA